MLHFGLKCQVRFLFLFVFLHANIVNLTRSLGTIIVVYPVQLMQDNIEEE